MLLYLLFIPLIFFLLFSQLSGARKLALTFTLFIGGYGYIMLREATKHHGERKRKREFLERVAPRNDQRSNSNGGGQSSGGKQASYNPSPSPSSRGKSSSRD